MSLLSPCHHLWFACNRTTLILLVILFMPSAFAERVAFQDVFQNRKKIEHELSGVNRILQDQQGFIWFGCEKGLARYDGVDVKIYRHDPSDSHSITSDYIHDLLIDLNGVMWVATEAGVCYFDAEHDHFYCGGSAKEGWPTDEANALIVDRENTVFAGTVSGLYRISAERKRFLKVTLNGPLSGKPFGVSALTLDSQNVIWVGTESNGLISLDPQTDHQRHFLADPNVTNALVSNRITSMDVDTEGRLWMGTHGGGVSVLSADRTQFENYFYTENQPSVLPSNMVWDVFADNFGDVWLSVDNQGGLIRYNRKNGFTALRNKPYDPTSIGANQVRTSYVDKKGDLWVGLFPSGIDFHNRATSNVKVFRHDPGSSESISHSAILAIFKDANGDIWIGTEAGLNKFDPITGTFIRYSDGLTAKAVLSIDQFDKHTLWVGTWSGGLFAFDLKSKKFRPIDTRPPDPIAQNSMFIWNILRDRNGNMWIATEFDGAGVFDRKSGQFRFYSESFVGAGSLPNNYVRDLMEDHNGAIWMATNEGIVIFKPGQKRPHWILRDLNDPNGLQGERIFALYEDRHGRVWVGTEDKETFVYDPVTAKFRPMGAAQGMPPGLIGGFVEDAQGYIWVLTTNGLVKVDSETFVPQVFGAEHGLTGNSFNRNAALLDADGLLYIGGAEGLNIFKPENLGEDSLQSQFPLWLTRMRIMNRDAKVGTPQSPLKKAITFEDKVILKQSDLMFAFDFAALDYRHSKDMRYAYMLEGFDQDWNYVGDKPTATYTNIPPGKYKFVAKASYGKNDWVRSRELEVLIRPAPWIAWWAYLGYGLILMIVGYFGAHYFRLRGHTEVYKALSSTDILTGVANRAGLTQAAKVLFARKREQCLCVLFMDIDHFKQINDAHGHESGDRVLVEVAEVFRQCLRQTDLIGRWGGEEFVLVWTGDDKAAALHVAEKIRQTVSEHVFAQEPRPIKVTASLGIAFAESGETFEAAVNRADQALYRAKGAGRNCIVVAD